MENKLKTLDGNSISYEFQYSDSEHNRVSSIEADNEYIQITKEFGFEAGHYVPGHGGRCKYVHGHSYKLFVTVGGYLNEQGMVIDFQVLSQIVKALIDKYDHGFLNDYFELPTAEIMASYFRKTIQDQLPDNVYCDEVRLYETAKCCAISKRRGVIIG